MTRPERNQQILHHFISKTEETGIGFYVILSILKEIFLELVISKLFTWTLQESHSAWRDAHLASVVTYFWAVLYIV